MTYFKQLQEISLVYGAIWVQNIAGSNLVIPTLKYT